MKFGVEIPVTVEDSISLYEKNGNSLWKDYTEKEMINLRIFFKLLERRGKLPVGYTEIICHLVFDLKLDMTRKAQYTTGVIIHTYEHI